MDWKYLNQKIRLKIQHTGELMVGYIDGMKLPIVRFLDASVALLWGFGTLYLLSGILNINDLADVLMGLAVVNSFMILDVGFSGYLYSRYRRLYIERGVVGNLGIARLFFLVFLIVGVGTLIFSISYAIFYLSESSKWIFFGFSLYSAFVLSWGVVGSVVRAEGGYLAYFSVELLRKLFSVVAVVLFYLQLIDVLFFIILMFLCWLGAMLGMLKYIVRLCSREGKAIFEIEEIKKTKVELGDTLFYSMSNFSFFQLPYYIVYFIDGSGVGLVFVDLFNKLRRVLVVYCKMVVDVLSPRFTLGYYSGRFYEFRRSVMLSLVLSCLASAVGFGFAMEYGDFFLGLLFHGKISFSTSDLMLMAICLLGFVFHIMMSYFYSHIGRFNMMKKLVFSELFLSLVFVPIVWIFGFRYEVYMVVYSFIALLGSVFLVAQCYLLGEKS